MLDDLQVRLELGETEFAMNEVSRQINHIRETRGNYDRQLAPRYILLGDAQVKLGESEDALESFNSALHVTRMNAGINSSAQTEVLYRVSEALLAVGDFENANRAQERAYAVLLDELGPNNPRLLPGMLNLIKWYESNRRFWAAKVLYIDAFYLADKAIPADDVRRVELARAFAVGMRNTVFPPMSGDGRFRPFSIRVPGYEEPPPGSSPPSSYAMGYMALNNVQEFVDKHAADDVEMTATAKLNLADWHQLFGRESKASRMYREIWDEMESLPALRKSVFAEPTLLYIRLPEFSTTQTEENTGIVELLLTVSYRGTVTGRISQVVEPKNDSIEFRTRVAAREARFRPALNDGKPVTTRNFLLTHYYPLPRKRP